MTEDRGDIFDKIVGPFLKIAPWVIEHPMSKRLPRGYSFSDGRRNYRNGFGSADKFCVAYQAARDNFPGLFRMLTIDEELLINRVFEERGHD